MKYEAPSQTRCAWPRSWAAFRNRAEVGHETEQGSLRIDVERKVVGMTVEMQNAIIAIPEDLSSSLSYTGSPA
jgi:hypothetical protein